MGFKKMLPEEKANSFFRALAQTCDEIGMGSVMVDGEIITHNERADAPELELTPTRRPVCCTGTVGGNIQTGFDFPENADYRMKVKENKDQKTGDLFADEGA